MERGRGGFQETPRPVESKEAPDGFTKLSINIFYSRHATKEDLVGFKERLQESDIYIPEGFGWDQADLDFFNNLSSGALEPSYVASYVGGVSPFVREQLNTIYKSLKQITVVDVSAEHPYGALDDPNLTLFIRGDFSNTLGAFKEYLGRIAKELEQRGEYMESQLLPRIKEVLEHSPDLRKKQELRILMTLGSGDTAVYQNLKRSGLDVRREFHSMPYVFDFVTEGTRRYVYGKEVDDQLAAKMMLQWFFSGDLLKICQEKMSSEKESLFLRKVIGAFDFKDAEEVYNVGIVKGGKNQQKKRLKLFFAKIKQKGITLPRTEKELDEFLAKPLPRSKSQSPKP